MFTGGTTVECRLITLARHVTVCTFTGRHLKAVASLRGGGSCPLTLFIPDFQIRANPVRNMKRWGGVGND